MSNTLFIDDDGTMTGVASPLTEALGLHAKERVSHVEPVNGMLRWLFHSLRERVKDDSTLAEFTRHWPCLWQARILNGPILGPFKKRQVAIAAEIKWLNEMFER